MGATPGTISVATRDMVLVAKHLRKAFKVRGTGGRFTRPSAVVTAVDDVSFEVETGETLGIVGESGCGKSTVARLVTGLLAPDSGTVEVGGAVSEQVRRRRRAPAPVQMVFQDPTASLDPRMRVRDSVGEALVNVPRSVREIRTAAAVTQVGLSPSVLERYPHELSGGEAQRVCVARATVSGPKVVVLDEAVSALDVSTQSMILEMLAELQEEVRVGYVFISHDLRAVRRLSDCIVVMYFGQIVEVAPVVDGTCELVHPYSVALRSAETLIGEGSRRIVLEGEPPSGIGVPSGCRFASRCPVARERCRSEPPLLVGNQRRAVACHYPGSLG